MPPIENARGFKGDKEITKTVVEKDDRGNTVESEYNKDGVCLRTRMVKWSDEK